MLRSPDVEMKNLGASMMKTELKINEQINLLNKEISYPYKYNVSTDEDGILVFNIYVTPTIYSSSSSGGYFGTSSMYNTYNIIRT